jgi:hypothetical protein
MLNRHPAIAVCRETDFYHFIYRRRWSFGNLSDIGNRKRLVKEYLATQRIQRMQLDLHALEKVLLQEAVTYPALFLSILRLYAQAHGKRRCGEKTPQHAMFTETLCDWYPGARIIHIVRDPRDVVASLLRLPSAPNSVIGAASLWLRRNRAALRSQRRSQYLLVRYEQLAAQPEEELRRVCVFVGEEYSAAMLEPNWDPTADRPWFQRAEQPVSTQRVGVWRKELSDDEIALVERMAGTYMRRFAYEPVGKPVTSCAILRELVFAALDAVRRRLGEFPGLWYSVTRSTQLVKEEAAKERYRSRHWTTLE